MNDGLEVLHEVVRELVRLSVIINSYALATMTEEQKVVYQKLIDESNVFDNES